MRKESSIEFGKAASLRPRSLVASYPKIGSRRRLPRTPAVTAPVNPGQPSSTPKKSSFMPPNLAAARDIIARRIAPLSAVSVPLAASLGRVLRQEARAAEDLPAFDRSAMDGYAVIADDPAHEFRIVAEIQPGAPSKRKIQPGECARIFTGAPIPPGASQVIMQENVRVAGNSIIPQTRTGPAHIRHRGEDAHRGDLLLQSGTRLGPGELALLASLGVARPRVSRPPRVAHFVTGNELVAPGRKLRPGQIRDSNSFLVAGFLQRFGGELVHQERVPDDFKILLAKTRAVRKSCDLLLLSGGASMGEHDFGQRLLAALGFQLHFTGVNLRPGKPLVFATRGRQAAFVLPGNPVSHLVTLHLEVRLALDQFAGAPLSWPMLRVPLVGDLDLAPSPRESFLPAHLENSPGAGLVVRARRWQSSGDVTGLAGVNALLHWEAGAAAPRAGDLVSVLMLEVP